jgi:hypothetical protein
MQRYQFLLLTYWLEPQFLQVRAWCLELSLVTFKTLFNAESHFSNSVSVTPVLTHTIPHLLLKWDGPMFPATSFEPSNVNSFFEMILQACEFIINKL